MNTLEEAYADLVKAAESLARDRWVSTGTMPPQLNAMLAAIWIELAKLRKEEG